MTRKRQAKPIGSMAVLARLKPWHVLIMTILLSNGMVGLLRVITEGSYYDKSLASRPGDDLLGLYLAAASWIIHGDERVPNAHRLLNIESSRRWHYATAGAGLLAGVGLQLVAMALHGGKQTSANTYHNLVVVSVLAYFVVSVLPVVAKTHHRKAQIIAVIGLLGWVGLLMWDIKAGNLQRNNSRWAMP
jgi:hypothetical protein